MKNRNNIFIFIIFLILFFLSTFSLVFAAGDDYLQVNIPGLTLNLSTASCPTDGTQCNIGWIGQYISAIYQYGVGLAAVLAVVMIMAGGFIWLMSGGSPDKVGVGKDFITAALTGLILALFSFLILQTINPKLVGSSGVVSTGGGSSTTGNSDNVSPEIKEYYNSVAEAQGVDPALVDNIMGDVIAHPIALSRAYSFSQDNPDLINQMFSDDADAGIVEDAYNRMTSDQRNAFTTLYNSIDPASRNQAFNYFNPEVREVVERLFGGN